MSPTLMICATREMQRSVTKLVSALGCWAKEQELMAAIFSFRSPRGSLGWLWFECEISHRLEHSVPRGCRLGRWWSLVGGSGSWGGGPCSPSAF